MPNTASQSKTKKHRIHPSAKISYGRRGKIRRELSAGGVAVREEAGQLYAALLKTEHKKGPVWVLPKGHVELHEGEGAAEAARREVMEEAGLSDLSIKDQLGVTRFKFQVEDGMVYKTVHYFLMMTGQKQLTPQAEEDILEAKWFPIDAAITALEYDTDQEIVRRAKEKITGVKEPRPRRAKRGATLPVRHGSGRSESNRRVSSSKGRASRSRRTSAGRRVRILT